VKATVSSTRELASVNKETEQPAPEADVPETPQETSALSAHSSTDIKVSERAINAYLTGLSSIDKKLSGNVYSLIKNGSYDQKTQFLAENLKGRLSFEIGGVHLNILSDGSISGQVNDTTRSCAGPTECVHWTTHYICANPPYVDWGGSHSNCYPQTECDTWGDGHCGNS